MNIIFFWNKTSNQKKLLFLYNIKLNYGNKSPYIFCIFERASFIFIYKIVIEEFLIKEY